MRRSQIQLSLDLEQRLEQAAERIREAIEKPRAISLRVQMMRRGGRVIEPIPSEVVKWFEETDDETDN